MHSLVSPLKYINNNLKILLKLVIIEEKIIRKEYKMSKFNFFKKNSDDKKKKNKKIKNLAAKKNVI